MDVVTLPIYNTQGKEIDNIALDNSVFGEKINTAAIYQAVNAYRANQRKGLASTKTRGEVWGGGRKPWRQKGTGRARVGSTRSPLWRHGGVVFGPHPRDFSYTLPKKIRRLALKSAFLAKVKEKNLIILDSLNLEKAKTKEADKIFNRLKIDTQKTRVLLLLDTLGGNLKRALQNLKFLQFKLARDANVYEVLAAQKLMITTQGFKELTERLKAI